MKYLIVLSIVLIGLAFFWLFVPKYIDKSMNQVVLKNPIVDAKNQNIPFIADLHCDELLWHRNLLKEVDYGHVDLPRMQKADMALQFFTIVSKTPKGINIESNSSKSDVNGWLSFAQLLPLKTWFSIKERAIYQCKKLHQFVKNSQGQLVFIDGKNNLAEFVHNRNQGNKAVACMLGIEGAHCLEGDLKNLEVFYNLGVRYMGLTHFFDNEWGGSAHGEQKGGLTEKGKELVRKMEKLHMIIDLAHASPQTVDDILAMTTRPLIISHTGVKGMCDNVRNLSDKHLDEIGKRNGLVGIGLWETAVCGTDAKATAQSIKYVVDRIGIDKVALGSDFDGAIKTAFDVTGLPLVAIELDKLGYNQEEINKIMGGNVRDFLLRNLPK